MSISVKCGQCGRRLKAPDGAAGRTAKCPKCGGELLLPSPDAAPERQVTETPAAAPASDAVLASAPPAPIAAVVRTDAATKDGESPSADARVAPAGDGAPPCRLEAEYRASGKTTVTAVALMAASSVPAAVAGVLVFLFVLLGSWLVGYLMGGAAGLLHSFSGFLSHLVWEAWRDAQIPFHLVVDLVLLAVSWAATFIGWVFDLIRFLAPPIVALVGPVGCGTTIGGVIALAGKGGKNRNTPVPLIVAGVTAILGALIGFAMVFPDLKGAIVPSRLDALPDTFLRLDELAFGSTVAAWIFVAVGLFVSVGGAVWHCASLVAAASFCEKCDRYYERIESAHFGFEDLSAVASAFDRRDFSRFRHLREQCAGPHPYCMVRLHHCATCGEGFLEATTHTPDGSRVEKLRSIAVTRDEATTARAALDKG